MSITLKSFSLLLGTLAAIACVASPVTAADKPDNMTIVTSNAGGTFYPVGVGLAKILSDAGMRTSAQPGGGNSNVISVSTGKANMGLTFTATASFAAQGKGPFKKRYTNLRALATLYNNDVHIAVTADSGITSIKELKGKAFASQGKSASSSTFFRMILEANGISEDDLNIVIRGGPAQGAAAVRDRRAAGFQMHGGAPNGSFTEAAMSMSLKFLDIDDATFAKIKAINDGFVRRVIPAGTYKGVDRDIKTMGAATILFVNQTMPENHAYAITKRLVEQVAELRTVHGALRKTTPDQMAKIAGMPVHPGAQRLYKEKGL